MTYDRPIQLLHKGIALSVILQLITEMLMRRPKPGRSLSDAEALFFGVHETIGIIAFILVLTRLMMLIDAPKQVARLFPWLNAGGIQEIWKEVSNELPQWLAGKLKPPGEHDLLAGTIHGLGLILVFSMGMTGVVMFIGMEANGSMDAVAHFAKEIHELLSNLLWVYLIGHVSMAVIHQALGHQVLRRIFRRNNK